MHFSLGTARRLVDIKGGNLFSEHGFEGFRATDDLRSLSTSRWTGLSTKTMAPRSSPSSLSSGPPRYRCVECSHPVSSLFTIYSKDNVRLTQCVSPISHIALPASLFPASPIPCNAAVVLYQVWVFRTKFVMEIPFPSISLLVSCCSWLRLLFGWR